MIWLENVSKSYPAQGGMVKVLQDINLSVAKGQRLGILGRNGAGKSTLIRMISGAERPTSGTIHRQMSVSWPLAFGGAFLGRLTGYDNFKFVCRLYDVDPDSKIDFVEEFSELGRYLREPLRTYSAGMRARLAFAVSMAVEFDCFLIDEIIAVGDSRFQTKCFDELFIKRADRALLIVSHHADFVREVCSSAAVLESGVLRACPSVDAAYELYSAQQAVKPPAVVLAPAPVAVPPDPVDAARAESAKGEILEDGASRIARIAAEFERVPGRSTLLLALAKGFGEEFEDFDFALRVVDHVKARSQVDTAIDLLVALNDMHGQKALYHVVLGDLLLRGERIQEATEAYRQATEIEPESFWGHRNLGIALFDIGCYAGARPAFQQALALPCPPALKRELVFYLLDCATYLGEDTPRELAGIAAFPGYSIEEVTAVHYHELGLLSVRVQGFCNTDPDQCHLTLSFQIGPDQHCLPVTGWGSNSSRRYAALECGFSYGAELVLRVREAPGPISVTLIANGEDRVGQGGISVRANPHTFPAGHPTEGKPADLASAAYAAHDFEACVLFSRLALAEGGSVDFEILAESLIALGRYHDAEHHLTTVFMASSEATRTGGCDGRLFDLLCAEIGRSRLPGWESRIESLIADRLSRDARDPNGLTNRGHLMVHENRVSDALVCYAKAAEKSVAGDVIHFSRGIFSAQFAKIDNPPPNLAPGKISPAKELVHLISCDATYFKRYGEAVVRSSRTAPGHEHTLMHVHIVDPDDASTELVRKLRQTFEFEVTSEAFPLDDAPRQVRIAFYTAARFMAVPGLLRRYQRPVLITETDCLINWSWPEIIDWCGSADFGSMQSSLTNFVPWTRIPAGIVYFDHRTRGLEMASDVRGFLDSVFFNNGSHKYDLWTIDQVALWLAWHRNQRRVRPVHLPMYSMLRLATGDKTNILS